MADLYEDWCRDKRAENGRKTLWRLIEHEGVRDDVLEKNCPAVSFIITFPMRKSRGVYRGVWGYPRSGRFYTWTATGTFSQKGHASCGWTHITTWLSLGRLGARKCQDDHDANRALGGISVYQHCAGCPSERQDAIREENRVAELNVHAIENRERNREARKNRASRYYWGSRNNLSRCGVRNPVQATESE